MPRLALAACAALLSALACAPAAHAGRVVAGLSQRDADAIMSLAHAHWPSIQCGGVAVVKVPKRIMRAAAAADRNRPCTILLRRDIRLSATGWCKALKPAFARLARGGRPSAVPYDCSVVVGPAPTRAKLLTVPGLSAEDVRRAYEVASAHWPTSRCRGREQLRWATNAQLLAQSRTPPESGTVIVGQARLRDARCITWLNADVPGWPARELCTTLAHEFGHLHGLGHSSQSGSLMAAVDGRSLECEAAFAAPELPVPDLPDAADVAPAEPVVVTPGSFGDF